MTENNNATEICLGKMALEALERSRNAMPVMEEEIADFDFWQITGMKVPMESILIWMVQKSRWGEQYIRCFMMKSCLMMKRHILPFY